MEKYFVFIFLAFIAEVLGTISGFGSSILFVPVASLYFDFKTVLGITAIFHVFSNLSKIALFRKGIQKDIVIKLGVPAVIFVTIGAFITTWFPTEQIELAMNIILIILSIYLIINFDKKLKKSNANLYAGGIASGFIAGVAGTGGAIRGITLSAFHLSKDAFIATSAFIDLGVDLSRAIVYTSNGYFKKENLILIPFLVLISILGSYLGKLILNKTSEKTFRYIVLGVIVATALFQLYRMLINS
ncbi:sulfite exporter TauE/SafE family protein [Pseudopedobacter beijingensis]|uniref:Probable membrane transporter protein n=1 Tax=Pseudopedobacter beijingensis TaxID=1207056 RepID=A0ABW4I8I0_9SPHI